MAERFKRCDDKGNSEGSALSAVKVDLRIDIILQVLFLLRAGVIS